MLIAVDFDNTIVGYDALFRRAALAHALIPPEVAPEKNAVRDYLRTAGQEERWTELQGEIYGARMAEAEPYPGVREFFVAARRAGIGLAIVSHKTRHPCRGHSYDLHAAARHWLERQGFFAPDAIGLKIGDVFFEPTKAEKVARIERIGATHCIDDLPEILTAPAFPRQVARFLFDPKRIHPASPNIYRATDWDELRRWLLGLSSLGLEPTAAPDRLSGGANNRVARQQLADGRTVLVKHYAPPTDGRHRFATERAFYRYAESVEANQIPTALGWNAEEQIGVFTCLEGGRVNGVERGHVDQALDFIATLNDGRGHPAADALPSAAEACFSVEAHLSAVRQRLNALAVLPAEDDLSREAKAFVQDILQPAWESIEQDVQHWPSPRGPANTLPRDECCVSPSDFGFHNCLHTAEGLLMFFDFEYAGWDDPAKLVCDFFCQPDIPVPSEEFDRFVTSLAERLVLPNAEDFYSRCQLLLPLYQVKWAGILLNEFTPAGRHRRTFALGAETAHARRTLQLARAQAMFRRHQLVA